MLLLGIAYSIVMYLKNEALSAVADVDKEIALIYKSRDKAEEEKLLNLNKQLTTTKSLLQAHTAWSVGFNDIQTKIEPRVRFMSLSVDAAKKSYDFHAVADSYTTVARQVAAFYRTDSISDIKLDKVAITGNGSVEFNMQLTFLPEKFLLKKTP